jgi:hypothetical protein
MNQMKKTSSNEDATNRRRCGVIPRRESGRVLGSLKPFLPKRRPPGFRVSHGGLTAMVFSNDTAAVSFFEALRLNVAMGGTFGLCCDLGESSA